MQVSVTLNMEGAAEEVGEWLRRFTSVEPPLASGAEVQAPEVVIDATTADLLVGRITDDARRALRFIAEHAPEVAWADVQRHLGMNGIRTGGVMASFGFAVNAGLPRPYQRDGSRRTYSMAVEVAPVMLDALDRYDQKNGQVGNPTRP